MTDAQFLLEVLSDGEPHSSAEILRRSFEERGHGLMVHSRAADLRKSGHIITCEHVPGKRRGDGWEYQLLGSLDTSPQSASINSSVTTRQEHASIHGPDSGRGEVSSEQTLFDMQERPAWA